eukprot:364623-Chlamydomonas_euryale.AAC.2
MPFHAPLSLSHDPKASSACSLVRSPVAAPRHDVNISSARPVDAASSAACCRRRSGRTATFGLHAGVKRNGASQTNRGRGAREDCRAEGRSGLKTSAC